MRLIAFARANRLPFTWHDESPPPEKSLPWSGFRWRRAQAPVERRRAARARDRPRARTARGRRPARRRGRACGPRRSRVRSFRGPRHARRRDHGARRTGRVVEPDRELLGFPAGISGAELTSRAVSQARKFGARTATPYRAVGLEPAATGGMSCTSRRSMRSAKAVILATGAEYRRLPSTGSPGTRAERLLRGRAARGAALRSGPGRSGRRRQLRRPGCGLACPRRGTRHPPSPARRPARDDVGLPHTRGRARRRRHPRPERDRRAARKRRAPRGGHAHRRHAAAVLVLFLFLGAGPCTEWLGDAVARRDDGFLLSGDAAGAANLLRQACRASSPPATCDPARRSAARRPSGRDGSRYSSSTSTSHRSSRRRCRERARLQPSRQGRGARAPAQVDGCEDCLRMGGKWLHLRICLTCGHVGCCDNSPNRHATAHHHSSSHPIIRSIEPGEAGAGATWTTSRS